MLTPIRRIWRVVIGAGSFAGICTTILEWSSRDNREVLVELIGSVVSLHSIYLGIVIFLVLILLVAVWPGLVWVYNFRQNSKYEILEKQRQETREAIELMNDFRDLLKFSVSDYEKSYLLSAIGQTQLRSEAIERCKQLEAFGLLPKNTSNSTTIIFIIHQLEELIPIANFRGIEAVREQLLK